MREYLQAFRDEWNKARLFVLKLDDMVTVPSVDVAKFCSQNRLALLKAGKKFTKHAPSVNLVTQVPLFAVLYIAAVPDGGNAQMVVAFISG